MFWKLRKIGFIETHNIGHHYNRQSIWWGSRVTDTKYDEREKLIRENHRQENGNSGHQDGESLQGAFVTHLVITAWSLALFLVGLFFLQAAQPIQFAWSAFVFACAPLRIDLIDISAFYKEGRACVLVVVASLTWRDARIQRFTKASVAMKRTILDGYYIYLENDEKDK